MRPGADRSIGCRGLFQAFVGALVFGLVVASASTAGSLKAKPAPVKAFVKAPMLAAGLDHSLAVTSSGSVYGWGWNMTGQLGNGSIIGSDLPVKVRLPGRVKATAVG